ncbi:MAG: tRNA (adenosine(37)-N6)-threonylcarbamoyltransferase complex transferase subunit TsaD, partial [Clostridia bacterium]|nr:tRNA (adenosine(37)-N6)-threonylcarbamoyltransferase complex transferase subunit TsaD [Clostridia bacterium]
MAYLLGLESSCDETAAAVVYADENGKLTLLSDVVASQVETHRLYGGVVPEIAGRAHIEAISQITYEALEKASVSPEQLSCVAVTGYPGLIGALLVAVNFAKAFALRYRLPLVSVDHIKGHVAAAYLTDTPPVPPFTALVTSGGHTSLFYVKDY